MDTAAGRPEKEEKQTIATLPVLTPYVRIKTIHAGASPSGKAAAFGADIRGFESSRPSLIFFYSRDFVNDDLPSPSEPPQHPPPRGAAEEPAVFCPLTMPVHPAAPAGILFCQVACTQVLCKVHSNLVFAEKKTGIFPGSGATPITDFECTHRVGQCQ